MKTSRWPLFTLLTLFGCSGRSQSTYRYGNVCITRVDEPGHSYFYWGTSAQYATPDVSVDYHAYGESLAGYMVFNPDKSVNIIGVMGYFETTDSKHPVFIKHPPNEQFIQWHDSIAGHYRNVVWLRSDEALERQENAVNKSGVLVSPRE